MNRRNVLKTVLKSLLGLVVSPLLPDIKLDKQINKVGTVEETLTHDKAKQMLKYMIDEQRYMDINFKVITAEELSNSDWS